jgi:hypothetical protein
MAEKENEQTPERGGQRPARLPYEKPRVISEDVFETLALSCALANPFVCPGGNPDRS